MCLVFLFPILAWAQLDDFCKGGKGDPIFLETFGDNRTLADRDAIGTTTYTYIEDGQPDDGEYTISSRFNWFPGWFDTTDRTEGDVDGRALIVNADDNMAGEFFERNITGLCPSTTYEFSTWLLNISSLPLSLFCFDSTGIPGGIPINVRFEIWDEADTRILASGDTGDIFASDQPLWEQYGLTFTTFSGQEGVILRILNNGRGGCGNDLALDDIQFVTCGDRTEIITTNQERSPLQFCDVPAGEVELIVNTILSVFTNRFYQWEQSLDGITYTSIPNENGESYVTENLTDTGNYFYRVRIAESNINLSNNSCNSLSDVFLIQILEKVEEPVTDQVLNFCSGDPIVLEGLPKRTGDGIRWYSQPVNGDLLFEGTRYEVGVARPGNSRFFVEAFSPGFDCPSQRLEVSVLVFNEFENLQDESVLICPTESTILTATTSASTYLWSTGATTQQIEVSIPDLYTVEITNSDGCPGVEQFRVNLFVAEAVISEIQTVEEDIVVSTEGPIADYEFSLDGISFQKSPVFNNIETGNYTIFIRDIFSCNTSDQRDFFHLNIPKHFSPNGDGFIDEFVINEVGRVFIFTRFGKLIAQGENGIQWDGTYNGKNLPSDSYWYLIEVEDSVFRGHILLKR